jgi:hypothetical protein
MISGQYVNRIVNGYKQGIFGVLTIMLLSATVRKIVHSGLFILQPFSEQKPGKAILRQNNPESKWP